MVVIETGEYAGCFFTGELHDGIVAHMYGDHGIIAYGAGAFYLVSDIFDGNLMPVGIKFKGFHINLRHHIPELHIHAPPIFVLGSQNLGNLC